MQQKVLDFAGSRPYNGFVRCSNSALPVAAKQAAGRWQAAPTFGHWTVRSGATAITH